MNQNEGMLDNIMKEQGISPANEVPDETKEKVQEKSEEAKVEVKEEPKVEVKPKEEKTEAKADAKKVVSEVKTTWYDEFKKETGKDYNEVKPFFEKIDELSQLEPKFNELDTNYKKVSEENNLLKAELDEIIKEGDPLNTFGGDVEAYERWALTEKLSEGKPKKIKSIVTKLVNELDTMSDIDVLVNQFRFDAPDAQVTDERIKEMIFADVGVNFKAYQEENDKEFSLSNPELTTDQMTRIQLKASQAKSGIRDIISKIEVPKATNKFKEAREKVQQQQETLKQNIEKWETEADRIAETLPNIEYKRKDENGEEITEFTFEIDSDFRSKVPEMVKQYVLSHNLEPTKENIDGIKSHLLESYDKLKRHDIRSAMIADREAKLREEYDKKYENNQPFNESTPPEVEDESYETNINKGWKRVLDDMNNSL